MALRLITEQPRRETLSWRPQNTWMGLNHYLQFRMSVELIQEVHDSVSVQHCSGHYNMFLILSPMTAVGATLLLTLHPSVSNLFQLWEWWMNRNTIQFFLPQGHTFSNYSPPAQRKCVYRGWDSLVAAYRTLHCALHYVVGLYPACALKQTYQTCFIRGQWC